MSMQSMMKKPLTAMLLLFAVLALGAAGANAQGAFMLGTTPTGTNGQAANTFGVEATNTVVVYRLGIKASGSGIRTVHIFYKAGTDAIIAPTKPATISTGWTKVPGSAQWNGVSGTVTQIPLDVNVPVPGGTTMQFTIAVSAGSTINYTTGANGSPQDGNIKLITTSWGGSYNATAGSSFSFQPRGFNGTVWYDLGGTKWTGANSTDWNDADNWDPAGVPDFDTGVIIPDAATTPNDCTLPVGAECKGMKIDPNGILVGDAGTLNNYADWDNEGTFVPGTSVINYVGDSKAAITTGGTTVGNINIMKDSPLAQIDVTDSWTAAQNGTFAADANSVVVFNDPTLDFSATTFDNKGLFKLGLTGGGTVAVTQDITASATTNLGRVEVNVADPMDSVTFATAVACDDLKVEGLGNVTFNADLELTTRFETTMEGMLSVVGNVTGDADLFFNSILPVTFGSVTAGSINHINEGDIVLGATVLSRDANFTSTGPLGVATITGGLDVGGDLLLDTISTSFGALSVNGTLTVAGKSSFLRGSGNATGAFVSSGNVDYFTDGFFDIGVGVSSAADVNFNASGAITIGGDFNISRLSINKDGDISVAGDLTIIGDMLDDGLGNFEISGALIAAATGSQSLDSVTTRPLKCARVIVRSPSALFTGEFNPTQSGAANPAFLVEVGGGAHLGDGAIVSMGSVGSGPAWARIEGTLTTVSGASTLRPIIRGQTPSADHGQVVFVSGSSAALDGITFADIGAPSQAFAISINPGAVVLSFNYVQITDADSSVAAIELGIDNIPAVILDFSVSGDTPTNIDATAVSGVRIEIKKSGTGAGTRYGVPFEVDPNGVLFWEDPPVLAILSNTILPNVLAETPFTETLQATGGNEPILWSLLNAQPWMSINATTGELSGTPPRTAVGEFLFAVFISDSTNPALTASQTFTMVVDALVNVPVNIVTPTIIDAQVDQIFAFSLTAAGGTGQGFTWSLVGDNPLPVGLTLEPNGVIRGIPAKGQSGTFPFTARVEDSQGNSSVHNYSLKVNTEFSDPAVVNGILSDGSGGGSGGCAFADGRTTTLLYILMALMAFVGLRRYTRRA